jgi:hypothetical protein
MDPITFKHRVGQDRLYKLTKKSDIYSLGVLFWELTSGGSSPFENKEFKYNKILEDRIMEGERETPIPNTNPKFVRLYQSKYGIINFES